MKNKKINIIGLLALILVSGSVYLYEEFKAFLNEEQKLLFFALLFFILIVIGFIFLSFLLND